MRPQLEKDVDGTLYATFPTAIDLGTCTVTIKRSGGADLANTAVEGEDVEDPLSVALVAGAAAGATSVRANIPEADIPLPGTAVTLISATTHRREENVVKDVAYAAGNTTLYLQRPISFALQIGDTVRARTVSYDLLAAQLPYIEETHRAVFVAEVRGKRQTVEVIFDVGLRATSNPATLDDIAVQWPDYHRALVTDWEESNGKPLVDVGYEVVCRVLWAMGKNPNRLRELEPLRPLIANRALRHAARFGMVPAAWVDDVDGYIELLDGDFDREIKRFDNAILWYDNDDDGREDDAEVKPVSRQIRLTR